MVVKVAELKGLRLQGQGLFRTILLHFCHGTGQLLDLRSHLLHGGHAGGTNPWMNEVERNRKPEPRAMHGAIAESPLIPFISEAITVFVLGKLLHIFNSITFIDNFASK